MSGKKSRKTAEPVVGVQRASMDTDSMFWFGDLNAFGNFPFPTAPVVYQKPRAQVFYMTRNWYERSTFIKSIIELKTSILNYGFQVVAKDKKDQKAIEKWASDEDGHGMTIRALARDTWQEWLVQDNCIGMWRKSGIPFVYPVEHSSYHDDFGIENLAITHSLSAAAIAAMPGLSAKEKSVLSTGKIQLQKQGKNFVTKDLYFQVVKRTRVGAGLAWPKLRTLFNTVATWESLELADWQLADAMRTVYEMHLVGHEIKSGPHAGANAHFLKKKRADTILSKIRGKEKLLARVLQMVVNFDHKIEYPRPDPKHLGKERYSSVEQRLLYWSAPFGQLAFLGQSDINPMMPSFMKSIAKQERDYVGPFLKVVLTGALNPPKPIEILFADDIFLDQRLMLEVMKSGLSAGPLSSRTFLEGTMGKGSAERERAHKEEEHDLPDHQTLPKFDPNHGHQPGKAGKPLGGKDKQKRQGKT
jgi:hypothetical protein